MEEIVRPDEILICGRERDDEKRKSLYLLGIVDFLFAILL